ncbi:PRA1 family protein 2 isoform X2 [Sciurus carolinensis]|uniref:PRA1 family protein 2 isoform X2 n=1 Tax=Sciurus carolinensis TaxID=30640 RepID=UPI001FB49EC0|nr:PRA1 family protein 2 isoform X2 [Sciurus carolinensis]
MRICAVYLYGLPAQTPFPGVLRGVAGSNGCCSPAALRAGPATGRMSEVRLPPLRALDDFVLGSARLAAPDPCDPQRWCHRVINNLLYYQTNYLLCFGFGLALSGYVRPLHTLLSALAVVAALGVLVWAAETRAAVRRCRRSHPAACLASVLAVGLLVLWVAGGACTFLISIAGPVLCESSLP